MHSCIFEGGVRHRRFVDKPHSFHYKLFMMYLDLSELETVFKPYWFWSAQRLNIAAFRRKYYMGSPQEALIDSVKSRIAKVSEQVPDRVCLLTHLAYGGYCFNPISLYLCFHKDRMTHCIAEVTNTPWKKQRVYVLPVEEIKAHVYHMQFTKQMHVSPFLGMDYTYQMRLEYVPHARMIVHIENWQNDQKHFDATLSLQARAINRQNLAWMLLKYPLMTLKVSAAIHWQAIRLLAKRVKFYSYPKSE